MFTEQPAMEPAKARAMIRARGIISCAVSNSEESAVKSNFNQGLGAAIAATSSPQEGRGLRGRGGRFQATCKIATILLI